MSIIQHRRQYNLIKIKYLGARAFSGRYREARRSLAGKALRVKSLHTFLCSISSIESHVRCYIIIRYVPGDDAEEKGREGTGRKDGRGRKGRTGRKEGKEGRKEGRTGRQAGNGKSIPYSQNPTKWHKMDLSVAK